MTRLALLIALAAVGCGSPAPSPDPISATARNSDFELVFSLPRSTWRTSDAIEGEAVLSVLSPDLTSISGSGPMAFRFTAEGIVVEPARPASCERFAIASDVPIPTGIERSGSVSPDDGSHPFDADWFRDPELHLPPGAWRIEAIAEFYVGSDCEGPLHVLNAAVDLTVVD